MDKYIKIQRYEHPIFGRCIMVTLIDGVKPYAERNQSERSEFAKYNSILEKSKNKRIVNDYVECKYV